MGCIKHPSFCSALRLLFSTLDYSIKTILCEVLPPQQKTALRPLQTVKKPLGCVEGPLPFD